MEIGFDYHTVCVGTCRTQSLPLLPSRPPLKVVTITRYPFSIIPRSSAPTAVANSFIFNVFFLIALQVLYRLFPGKTTFTASDESSGRKHFQNFPGTEPKRKDRRPSHEQNNLTRSNNNEQKWRKCRNVFVFFYPIWINSTFCEVWYVSGEVRRRCTFCLILCFMLCRNGFPLSFIFFPWRRNNREQFDENELSHVISDRINWVPGPESPPNAVTSEPIWSIYLPDCARGTTLAPFTVQQLSLLPRDRKSLLETRVFRHQSALVLNAPESIPHTQTHCTFCPS